MLTAGNRGVLAIVVAQFLITLGALLYGASWVSRQSAMIEAASMDASESLMSLVELRVEMRERDLASKQLAAFNDKHIKESLSAQDKLLRSSMDSQRDLLEARVEPLVGSLESLFEFWAVDTRNIYMKLDQVGRGGCRDAENSEQGPVGEGRGPHEEDPVLPPRGNGSAPRSAATDRWPVPPG